MSEMKLIMENWRAYTNSSSLLVEIAPDGSPETVGELLIAINKYTMISGNKAKRILKNIKEALKVFLDMAQDDESQLTPRGAEGDLYVEDEDIQKLIEWFEEALEGQWAEALMAIPVKAVINIISKDPIRSFLLQKIGKEALETLVGDILPGAATALKFTKWFSRMFKVSKETKELLDTAEASPKEMFVMIVKDIADLPDSKDTTKGFMGIFNIDDKWKEILHDKIEMKFIQQQIAELESLNPSTSLDSLNFNQQLVKYLSDEFEGRTLAGPAAA
tara:strand:+ start:436 stop:1260 length:825 start_codon:yes stop_codon:yes gene_type:complete